MSYSPTYEQRVRRKIRRMTHDDAREAAMSEREAIIRAMRTRLNEANPDATPEEIERRIEIILAAGSKPTTATVTKPALGIPADVQSARRAARKQEVAKMRPRRRG